ncbi:protein of unknown function [Magnetospirillum gryphiswaldense MSR-1 v2]|uniref:Uncharacterized protein n=1 Tax=Magnetospirillum gryphiswaldense (strain DSM 6361 / JCM 21280 / NBRC 15271 / MSR-1) TaxID=431944 RepID=V6EZY8_MAGGM|nr:protein of unknown function [Magnetospirillum gryphiswaldense MSR-1 v2]
MKVECGRSWPYAAARTRLVDASPLGQHAHQAAQADDRGGDQGRVGSRAMGQGIGPGFQGLKGGDHIAAPGHDDDAGPKALSPPDGFDRVDGLAGVAAQVEQHDVSPVHGSPPIDEFRHFLVGHPYPAPAEQMPQFIVKSAIKAENYLHDRVFTKVKNWMHMIELMMILKLSSSSISGSSLRTSRADFPLSAKQCAPVSRFLSILRPIIV